MCDYEVSATRPAVRAAFPSLMVGAVVGGLFAVAPSVPIAAQAVRFEPEQLAALEWRQIGPASQGGRVTDIEALPSRPSTIYVGTASGGVFKSVNHGTTWASVFDEQATLSIGDIAVSRSHPDHVWVGTGEANNRNSSPWGEGVYRSTDGGVTWQLMGLEETRHIGKVLIHPTNPNVVWVGALGHLFGPNRERGIYKTEDGGASWDKVFEIDENTGVVDMEMDPSDPATIYAAAYQRQRRAYGFNGGGPGGGLYKSSDGGESWTELTNGLPEGNKGRIGIDVSQENPNIVMAIVEAEDGGIFRSEDRGESWTKVNALNPRPMYYSAMYMDPNDDEHVYVLGTYMHRSRDGGQTFEQVEFDEPGSYGIGVHVDNHTLWIDPADSDHVMLGNDGGVYFSFDGGDRWTMANNLPIGQFYDIAFDMAEPYNVYGGLQDNQSVYGPSTTRSIKGILNQHWVVSDFGDGMVQAADPEDARYVYTSSQGGALIRHDPRTGDRKVIKPFPTDTAETYRYYWTAPFTLSPHDPATIHLGGNRLFTTRNRGMSWTASPDLTRQLDPDSIPIMGVLSDSTTLSRNDGVSGYGHITKISESPVVPDVLWVGTDDGLVQVSLDGGRNWNEVGENVPGLDAPMFVGHVEASSAAADRAYVAFDGHWDDDYDPHLFVTDDLGQSWRRVTNGLEGSVRVIREHPDNEDALFAGTDEGVFFSLDRGSSWTRLNNNMPRVPIHDLEIHPRDNDLIAGTHGRSIWILDNVGVLLGLDQSALERGLYVSPVNSATIFQPKYDVPRLGHGAFRGPNAEYGALLNYYLPSALDDGVRIRVRDARGATVRSFAGPAAAGFNRVSWDLRMQPLPMDTTIYPAPSLDVGPRGPFVLAGTYQIEVEAGGARQVTDVEVRADPLLDLSEEEQQRRYNFTLSLYDLQGREYYAAVQGNTVARSAGEALDSLEAMDVEESDLEMADSLRNVIEAAADEVMSDNGSLRGWWRGLIGEFDGGPSTQGTMTGPTDDQVRRLLRTESEFTESLVELDRVILEVVPALNALLERFDLGPVTVLRRENLIS